MHITFLLTQDLESPSGLGRYYPLARELAALGNQSTIIALHSNYNNLTERDFIQDGVRVRYVAPMHVLKQENVKSYYPPFQLIKIVGRATWDLSKASLSSTADIIHIGKPHPMNSIAGLLSKYINGRQVYLDCDDYEAAIGHFTSSWQRRGVEFFEDWAPKRVAYTTTNTYFTQNRLMSIGIPQHKIIYLSNGVDRRRFSRADPQAVQELQSKLGITEENKIIAFIGSLSRPGHPVEILLKSFSTVRQVIPDAKLMIVGGGDDFQRLQKRSQDMGFGNSVIFPGRIAPEQVANYYHVADVTVDPVHDDDAARGRSPLKLFESWACNVPFVSQDVGDRKILLGDPPAGILTKPGNNEALSEAIIRVLTEPNLKRELQNCGGKRVEEFYWDKLAQLMELKYLENLPAPR
jgi:glycosyltransferase involved in cell wall biosynthesis